MCISYSTTFPVLFSGGLGSLACLRPQGHKELTANFSNWTTLIPILQMKWLRLAEVTHFLQNRITSLPCDWTPETFSLHPITMGGNRWLTRQADTFWLKAAKWRECNSGARQSWLGTWPCHISNVRCLTCLLPLRLSYLICNKGGNNT